MFDKDKFSKILREIISQYDSISEFTKESSLDRTYISKCINKKLNSPPSPNILRKISNNSNYNYIILMQVCGYLNDNDYSCLKNLKSYYTKQEIIHYSINLNFTTYNKLNEFGQKKVNDYIDDLVCTNKYKRI